MGRLRKLRRPSYGSAALDSLSADDADPSEAFVDECARAVELILKRESEFGMLLDKFVDHRVGKRVDDRFSNVVIRARADRPMNRSLQNRSTRPNRNRAAPLARISTPRARLVVVRVEELNYATPAEILRIRIRASRPTARGWLCRCGTARSTRGSSFDHTIRRAFGSHSVCLHGRRNCSALTMQLA
jgi:hypothetical protein